MARRTRTVAMVGLAVAAATALSACRPALTPRDPADVASFTLTDIATQPGAAFTVVGELGGGYGSQEILTTSFAFAPPPGPGAPPTPIPGNVTVNSKSGGVWNSTQVVTSADGIVGPNKPTIADVDGDGLNDFILPAGYFFSQISPPSVRGSITWWHNNGDGTFARNNVITGAIGSYHSVVYVDMDNDGKKDMVTTFEDAGHPAYPFGPPVAPVVRIEMFKGLGAGAFAAPVKLADGGGSLPVVFDVNRDGKLDIGTAQYFKVRTAPIPPQTAAGFTNESFVWFENTATSGQALDATTFSKHVIATGLGESFQILPVDNIDGNGKYGAIGINHVGVAQPTAPPQVVRLTPGSDVRQPWTVTPVASGFTPDATTPGQSSPGFTGEGDIDGDGDIDLVTSGDADWSIYWIERKADGSWAKHDLAAEFAAPGTFTNLGQASVAVADLNYDGKNEIVVASYNAGKVTVIERNAGTGGNVPAVPHLPDLLLRY